MGLAETQKSYYGGLYKDYEDWYDNGPGSESFKRGCRVTLTKEEHTARAIERGKVKLDAEREKAKKQPAGDGYDADASILFNPDENKSTLKRVPRFEDPVGECTDKVKVNDVPFLHKGPMVTGVKKDEEQVCNEALGCCGSKDPDDNTPIGISPHTAFGIRLCPKCDSLSDADHRDECEEDPCVCRSQPDEPHNDGCHIIWPRRELEIYIMKISNGYILSCDGEQTFYFDRLSIQAEVGRMIVEVG